MHLTQVEYYISFADVHLCFIMRP